MKRWKATIKYRSDAGLIEETHRLGEMYEIHDIVEAGPHWDCLIELRVERINHSVSPTLTIETAAAL